MTAPATKLRPVTYEIFARLLQRESGLALGPDKSYLLETRLAPVLRDHGLRDLDALAERLRTVNRSPVHDAVVQAMTTNETFFFRDQTPFTHLTGHGLQRLLASRPPGARLRFWSAAASSGQEAYSLAMIAAEQHAALAGRTVEILGTDLSEAQIDRAREGVYSQFEVQRGLPIKLLVKYFRKEGATWRVSEPLRAAAAFRVWNLLGDLRPLGTFDVVFCRNVLIYFDVETKSRVLAAIARQLAPDGLLYLGGAETLLGVSNLFAQAAGETGVYTHCAAAK